MCFGDTTLGGVRWVLCVGLRAKGNTIGLNEARRGIDSTISLANSLALRAAFGRPALYALVILNLAKPNSYPLRGGFAACGAALLSNLRALTQPTAINKKPD